MPLGTWLLDLPEMADVKERCHGGDAQVTGFCEFGLKDPENILPHKRPTALLATFQLNRAIRKCSGHHGLAHQWTKGYLSKRFGGVSRLGYSQRRASCYASGFGDSPVSFFSETPVGSVDSPPSRPRARLAYSTDESPLKSPDQLSLWAAVGSWVVIFVAWILDVVCIVGDGIGWRKGDDCVGLFGRRGTDHPDVWIREKIAACTPEYAQHARSEHRAQSTRHTTVEFEG